MHLLILFFILTVFCSCEKYNKSSFVSNELFLKAESVLDEFPKDERIVDFKKIHNILTNLSTKEKQFLKQLKSARDIAEKYNLVYVSLQDKFDEACKKAEATYWLEDGVHPTPMGHWIIKNEWMKGFQEI